MGETSVGGDQDRPCCRAPPAARRGGRAAGTVQLAGAARLSAGRHGAPHQRARSGASPQHQEHADPRRAGERGSIDEAAVYVREVIKPGDGSWIGGGHSGPQPPERRSLAQPARISTSPGNMVEAGKRMGIAVHDHIIAGDQRAFEPAGIGADVTPKGADSDLVKPSRHSRDSPCRHFTGRGGTVRRWMPEQVRHDGWGGGCERRLPLSP